MVQVVMRAMKSDGEQQMKLCSLAHPSSPAVCPGSKQVTEWYWSMVRELGTPTLRN